MRRRWLLVQQQRRSLLCGTRPHPSALPQHSPGASPFKHHDQDFFNVLFDELNLAEIGEDRDLVLVHVKIGLEDLLEELVEILSRLLGRYGSAINQRFNEAKLHSFAVPLASFWR
jgi:hypothetical protein